MIFEKLGSLASSTKPEVRNLGVILDSELCFTPHVNTVTKAAFYHVRKSLKFSLFSLRATQRNLFMHLLQADLTTVMLFLLDFLRKLHIPYNSYKMQQHPNKNIKERSDHSRFKRAALAACIIQDRF